MEDFLFQMFGFLDLAAFLTAIGAVVTALLAWGLEAVASLEGAIAASFVLQLSVGIVVTYIGIAVLRMLGRLIIAFIPKGAKA